MLEYDLGMLEYDEGHVAIVCVDAVSSPASTQGSIP